MHRGLEVVDRAVDVATRQRGDAQWQVGRAEAGDGEAGHHGQVGVRGQQRVDLGGDVAVTDRSRRVGHGRQHRQPAARRGAGPQAPGAQAGERVAGEVELPSRGGDAGRRRGERVVVLRDGRRLVEVAHQVEHLRASALQPPDRQQLGAVPRRRVGISGRRAGGEALLGHPLCAGQIALAHRHHHVDRPGDEHHRVATIDGQPLQQLAPRPCRPPVAEQVEVDRPPHQAHQRVGRAVGERRRGDQLVGQHQPFRPVRRAEQAVVGDGECLGQRHRIAALPSVRHLLEHRAAITTEVAALGGQAGAQPAGQWILTVQTAQCPLLQCQDAGPIERGAVLMDPQSTEPDRRLGQQDGVPGGVGLVDLVPERDAGLDQATLHQQARRGARRTAACDHLASPSNGRAAAPRRLAVNVTQRCQGGPRCGRSRDGPNGPRGRRTSPSARRARRGCHARCPARPSPSPRRPGGPS